MSCWSLGCRGWGRGWNGLNQKKVFILLTISQDIEDVCIAAVKEKDIEAKLKQVIAEWSVQDLTFSGIYCY